MAELKGVGALTVHQYEDDWLVTEPLSVPLFEGLRCQFVLEEPPADEQEADAIAQAIKNLLACDRAVLMAASNDVFRYYQDSARLLREAGEEPPVIESAGDVWAHVWISPEAIVAEDEGQIYISFSCNCDWEEEHGLQLVVHNGLRVNKVGPYDGHFTNASAYGDESLRDCVYASFEELAEKRSLSSD